MAALILADGLVADIVYLKNKSALRGEIISSNEDSITLKVPYGRVIIQRGHIERIETEDVLKRLLAEGKRLGMAGDEVGAEAKFAEALKLFPDSDPARRQLAKVLRKRAGMLLAAQKVAEAEPVLVRLAKLDPTDEFASRQLKLIKDVHSNADTLEKEAVLLARTGRSQEALEKFAALVRVIPEVEVRDARFIAQAHADLADQLLPVGRFRQADGHYDEAVRLDPSLAPKLVKPRLVAILEPVSRERVAHANKLPRQRWEEIAKELEKAESIDPQNILSAYALGEVYVKLGRHRDAASRFSKISGKAMDWTKAGPSFRELYDLAGKRVQGVRLVVRCPKSPWHDVGPEMKLLETTHFKIYHHNDELAKLTAETAEYFYERTYRQLTGKVPVRDWHKKCGIYLYASREEFLKQSGQDSWAEANAKTVSVGGRLKDHRISTFQTARNLLSSHVPHELTHIIQAAMFNFSTRIPMWLKEGLAVHNEPWFKHSFLAEVLDKERNSDKYFKLEKLVGQKGYPEEGRVRIFYAESLALVETLLNLKDMDTFNRFTRLTISVPFRKALRRSYGISVEAVEKLWQERLDTIQMSRNPLND